MASFLKSFASVAAALSVLLLVGCGDSSPSSSSAASAAGDTEKARTSDAATQSEPLDASDPLTVDLAAGEQIYGKYCYSCHAAGIAGAPKVGSAEAWGPRVAKGLDALVASTIQGVAPTMPPRGLCSNCTDADIRNTVAWMIAQ